MLPHHRDRRPKPLHRSVARDLRLNASRRKRGYPMPDDADELAAEIAQAVLPALAAHMLQQSLAGSRLERMEALLRRKPPAQA